MSGTARRPTSTPAVDVTTRRNTVLDYLRERCVLSDDAGTARVSELAGGVSGEAVLVEAGSRRVVVKRALGKLLVVDDWFAKQERAVTEAAAIEVLHRITPDQTPRLLDVDPQRFTLVMSAAPADWVPWKSRLLDGPVDLAVETPTARLLGQVVGTWHRRTAADGVIASRFDDYEAFEQLRVGPFHRVVAARHPDVASAVEACIEDLLTRRDCLVHGDFSPKNVLVSDHAFATRPQLMVLDYEVAHVGAAVFDIAFLQCHLLLKAAHRPKFAGHYREVAVAFLDGYRAATGATPGPRLGWHTACLLLARVDGTSPAGYLDVRGESSVRQIARAMLRADDPRIEQIWDMAVDTAEETSS